VRVIEKLSKEANRKRPIRNQMVTWPWKVKIMTPIRSGPNILKTARDAI